MRKQKRDTGSDASKLRPINLTRIAYSSGFTIFLFFFDFPELLILSLIHLSFSFLWFLLIELRILVEERLWWSGYVPAAADSCYLSMLVYVTGNVSSFLVMGYVILVTLSSMTDQRNYGAFTALFSSAMYALVGLLVYLGIAPPVNLMGAARIPEIWAILFASGTALLSFLLVNRIVSGLFFQLNQEIRDRKAAEAHLVRDLEMARIIQERMLPEVERLPSSTRLRLGSRYLALESVGGDLYDVIRLSPDRTAVFIADVSGHGVPAALVTAMAKAVFTVAVSGEASPGEMLRGANRSMYNFIGDLTHYLSAFLCVIDLKREELSYCVAGHPLALLYHSDERRLEELDTEDTFLLGVMPDFEFRTESRPLRKGDRILMFTDGVVEAMNPQGEQFGSERLARFLQENSHRSPSEFVRSIMDHVEEFCNEQAREDDVAVICIDYGVD
ncbi:MAG: serine/threonine-protein phosphatase [Leptospiraceae bacterium]|nr:serine/threonine-protein phosphatase [Leptospiraceae bacterium]